MPLFFTCNDCGWDSDEAKFVLSERPTKSTCPLCAGDNGRDGDIRFRDATNEEIARLKVI